LEAYVATGEYKGKDLLNDIALLLEDYRALKAENEDLRALISNSDRLLERTKVVMSRLIRALLGRLRGSIAVPIGDHTYRLLYLNDVLYRMEGIGVLKVLNEARNEVIDVKRYKIYKEKSQTENRGGSRKLPQLDMPDKMEVSVMDEEDEDKEIGLG